MDNYVFGYGSLICADSRARTGKSGEAIAATVNGIERSWSVPVYKSKVTAVGAIKNPMSQCNGVVFQVSNESLQQFDKRESEYDKILLPLEQFDNPENLPTTGNIWTYVGHNVQKPSESLPIAQSYLDVIINGAITYGPEFVETFFSSTQHWQHLLNDRATPRYPRFNPSVNTELHDQLMNTHIADVLYNRK